MTDTENPTAALDDADADQLAAMVGQASDEQLAEGMANPEGRKIILEEIFNRMADHVQADKIKGLNTAVHFVITEAPDGGKDLFEVVFSGGEVKVNREASTDDPKVTIITSPVPFLKLVTGQDSGPAMFLTGKLKIKGDLMFASTLASYFSIPKG